MWDHNGKCRAEDETQQTVLQMSLRGLLIQSNGGSDAAVSAATSKHNARAEATHIGGDGL